MVQTHSNSLMKGHSRVPRMLGEQQRTTQTKPSFHNDRPFHQRENTP